MLMLQGTAKYSLCTGHHGGLAGKSSDGRQIDDVHQTLRLAPRDPAS